MSNPIDSLHAAIMNIPGSAEGKAPMAAGGEYADGYQVGHRDARHAAAELALAYDAELERLRAIVACARYCAATGVGGCVEIESHDSPAHGPCTPENCKFMRGDPPKAAHPIMGYNVEVTGMGKLTLPDPKGLQAMSHREVLAALNGPGGYVDPVALQVLVDRGLCVRGDLAADIERKIAARERS